MGTRQCASSVNTHLHSRRWERPLDVPILQMRTWWLREVAECRHQGLRPTTAAWPCPFTAVLRTHREPSVWPGALGRRHRQSSGLLDHSHVPRRAGLEAICVLGPVLGALRGSSPWALLVICEISTMFSLFYGKPTEGAPVSCGCCNNHQLSGLEEQKFILLKF